MDALTPIPWVWIAVIVITNAVQALGSLFWGKQVVKAKDGRIQGLEDQLKNERVLKDERLKVMEDRLRTTEALLEDVRLMNPSRLREQLNDMAAMHGEQIDGLKEEIVELKATMEAQAADNLGTKAERDAALEEIASLERELDLTERERNAAELLARSHSNWGLRGNQPAGTGTLSARYIPQAPEDFSHLDNYPEKEGESA